MASNQILKLDDLPSELIVQIAGNTTPETVLALSQVSRIFQATCYDSFVFLECFNDQKWARQWLSQHTDDTDLIARYAVAESRHLQFLERNVNEDGAEVRPTASEQLRYLPNLVVSENSVLLQDPLYLHGQRLISAFAGQVFDIELDLKTHTSRWGEKKALICLMWASGFMRRTSLSNEQHEMEATLQREHSAITCFMYEELASGIGEERRDHIKQFHSDCLLGVGKMVAFIKNLYNSRRPAWSSSHIDVPHIAKMPLANSVRDLPSPYLTEEQTIEAWGIWMRKTRSARSLPAYLDDGEWVGYYTYSNHFGGSTFDPPMKGLRFRTRGPVTRGGGYLLEAFGTDAVDDFDLRLSVDADGYIVGTKSYRHQNTSWEWRLSSTPYGLYGIWSGTRDTDRFLGHLGGAVWLYKREWIEE
jgi:hypothetical protein